MPLEDKDSPKPLMSPLSDSVELGSFPMPTQLRSTGWLDAVHGTRLPASPSPPAASVTNNACAAAPQHLSSDAGKKRAQSSTHNEQTPTENRHPAEATTMGSPIPVESDYSDVHIQQLVSRVRQKARLDHYVTTPGSARGPAKTPALPLAPAKQNAFPCTSASSHPSPSDSFPQRSSPQAMPARSTATASPPTPVPFQHSPFGDSHVAEAIAQKTRSQWYSDDGTTTAFASDSLQRQGPQQPTVYSSALMQALSRTEGAAALRCPWTLSTQRGGSSAYYSESDMAKGSSSDLPPDMYVEGMRAKVAKQQWVALEKARQEVLEEARRRRDCPFAPQVSPYAARIRRPASLRPENRFNAEVIRRKQWLAKKQSEEVERELQSCTFRPLTLRTAQLDPAVIDSPRAVTTVFHDLYTEAENRRAFERDVKPQLVHQIEERRRPSPARMGPAQVAEVVERLCARSVVRSGVRARLQKDNADLVPYESDAGPAECAGAQSDQHHPTLSLETRRIMAAKVTSGERDGNIIKELYRHAEQGVAQGQLKHELDKEQARLARAEQVIELARERKRLQQEYYRAVLVAKFRALAQHVACAQHCAYRATAPQPVVQLARAALDVLSADEAEELLGAVERCGRHKLTEGEFVAVVLQYLAEQRVTPVQSALLRNAPPRPPSTRVAASAATLKRADSAPGIAGSAESSPAGLPRVKREKPDPEVIEQVRARRAQELVEWRKESQRKRAICDGALVEGADYTFQPAPRRLIPYACRPDVTVPVRSTKSEELRRAYLSARMQGTAPALAVDSVVPSVSAQVFNASRAIARELFARGTSDLAPSSTRERSRSAAARVETPAQREGGAAALTPTASGPAAISPASLKCPSAEASRVLSAALAGRKDPEAPERQRNLQAAAPAGSSAVATRQPASAPAAPAPTSKGHPSRLAARPSSGSARQSRCNVLAEPPSLVEQIMHSTPEDRARLGRELLLRQVREHQRRSGAVD
ncbi:MtQ subunit [Leishmania donovani]|uniref:Uncharacterized protein n=3 Tax=Leishmania donovani species complex TaxID=38574 RepID=E9AHD0_LEIIN|nr:conserved hypothetical protein [Leishmania infantum JPCM5]CAC9498985.1 hypothetical_protein_-_conserved [Leishmania infantum]CAJ1989924.1 MtQ subunit [Leishmania donovani]CBZ08807.1 conserved hypothetical protein [Leishmania infantum JPCM5]SUZ42941.1 hypothetical_protein_-_conserved [Leishmania infantum]VDZ45786.1 hypothetical_protein_conserved [Leishmania donovani]|eukprot:XP_003392631.1 conserved hypothetical protein [Leishmania infantum JPCM5]